MNHCRLGWGAVLVLISQFSSGLAVAAPPPLKPNEEIVKTKDGCGMVIDKTLPSAPYVREAFAKLTWGGACVDGLAMGEGLLSAGFKFPNQPAMLPHTGWVWYGRPFGPSETRWDNGAVQKNFSWDGKSVFYKTLDVAAPVWSKVNTDGSKVSDGETMVSTMLSASPFIFVTAIAGPSKSQQVQCPSAAAKDCEALWAQHAGPVIEHIKAFLAENEPKAKARMAEAQALAAQWRAKVGPAVVAKREADAKRGAGEESDKTTKKFAADQACWDKLNKAPHGFTLPTSEHNIERARYLQNLFKGECAGHAYAQNALKEADELLAKVPELKKQEAATAKHEAEQKKDKKETAELLGGIAGAVLSGKNSAERKKNAMEALGGGNASGTGPAGSAGKAGGANTGGASTGSAKVGEAREIGPTPKVERTEAVSKAAAEITATRKIDQTLCEAAIERWTELGTPYDEPDRKKYPWFLYPGSNARVEYERARYDMEWIRTCAKDKKEFEEKSYYINENLTWYGPKVLTCVNGYRTEDVNVVGKMKKECDKIPPGFDEWFARYRHNGAVSLEWARRSLADPNRQTLYTGTKEDNACKAQIESLEAKRRAYERTLQPNEIVRRSELTMWFINEANAIIDRTCAQRKTYADYRTHGTKQHFELMRVCNQMASRPCAARPPTDEKPSVASAPAAPLPSLRNETPSACDGNGSGASSQKCLVDSCVKQGGTPVVGACIACRGTPGGGDWTRCPPGSGGVSSQQ